MKIIGNKVKNWMLVNTNLCIILFAALLILTGEVWQYRVARENAINDVERITMQELNRASQAICDKLSILEMAADCTSWGIEDHADQHDSIPRFLVQLMKSCEEINTCGVCLDPYYHNNSGKLYEPVAIRDKKGRINTTQIAGYQHDYTQMAFYIKAMECDSDYWSEPYINGPDKKTVVSYSMTLHDKNNKAFGTLVLDVSLDWLSNIANQAYTLPSSFVTILSRKGHVIACPKDRRKDLFTWFGNEKQNDLINIHQIIGNLAEDGSGKMEFISPEGEKNVIFFEDVNGESDWIIAVTGSEEEIYQKLYKDMQRRLIITFASILLLVLIIWNSVRNINNLRVANEEKARIDTELRTAAKIQQGMLPKNNTSLQNRDDIDVYGLLLPAREVGGDLYDFYVKDEKLYFCIGDVSGKGMPASLMMAVTRSMFRIISAHEDSPQGIVELMNNLVNEMNELSLFVTLFVGVLDLPTGQLRYCNAGHDAPLIIHNDIQKLDVLANLPVGVMPHIIYIGQEILLDSDTMIFLYTDGLVEAKNIKREMFRENRMIKVAEQLLADGNIQPKPFTDIMTDEVNKFVGEAPQFDDLTTLAIRYTKTTRAQILNSNIVIKNDIQQLPELKSFIDDIVKKLRLQDSIAMQLDLALEEAILNIMTYAFPPDTEGNIDITAQADDLQLKFIIVNSGIAFNPTGTKNADVTLTSEGHQTDGLEIHLVRQYMDSVYYKRIDDKNILTLIKRI